MKNAVSIFVISNGKIVDIEHHLVSEWPSWAPKTWRNDKYPELRYILLPSTYNAVVAMWRNILPCECGGNRWNAYFYRGQRLPNRHDRKRMARLNK